MKKILKYIKQKLNLFFNRKYELKDIEKKILSYIGFIVLEKQNVNYKETYGILKTIGIHFIRFKKNKIHLYMNRLGLFIGKSGELIEYIDKKLKETLNNNKLEIYVHEYDLDLYLFSVDYKDYSDF